MAEKLREASALVPESELQRFRENTTGQGSMTWFINMALREFNDRMEQNPPLKEIVRDSVTAFLKDRRVAQRT